MYDAHDKTTAKKILTRKVKTEATERFSPSFGVHQGMIPDPNWPPAEFPEGTVAMQRKDRRVACDFNVVIDGSKTKVTGDLSRGGAMFLMPKEAGVSVVTIELRGITAEARVLSTSQRGEAIAHHAQFTDPETARALWKKLMT